MLRKSVHKNTENAMQSERKKQHFGWGTEPFKPEKVKKGTKHFTIKKYEELRDLSPGVNLKAVTHCIYKANPQNSPDQITRKEQFPRKKKNVLLLT